MKFSWARFIIEEMKFLKSFNDFKNFYDKLSYLIPRITDHYKETDIPLSLQIEPTNYCNVNCICCSIDKTKRKRGCMDFGLFQKIIDDAGRVGVKRIHLYLHGESLLHPQIIEMIRYIKEKGIGIQMATNGMQLDRKRIEDILKAGVNNADHIIFSLLGYSKKTHEKVMRGVKHDKVIQNIFGFLELRKVNKINGPVIETVMYIMPENKDERTQFVNYWKRFVDHVRDVGAISEQFSKFGNGNTSIPLRTKTCKILWERMTIYWNGDITICCADIDGIHVVGNMKENSIREIWNNNKFSSIKKIHKENKFKEIPLCAKCDW